MQFFIFSKKMPSEGKLSVLSVFICYDGDTGSDGCTRSFPVRAFAREVRVIERDEVGQLKQILLSIARAKGSEAIEWGKSQAKGQKCDISEDLSYAISSLKSKDTKDGCEYELKLYDRLKAIELYCKLCGIGDTATDGALYIDYDYTSVESDED